MDEEDIQIQELEKKLKEAELKRAKLAKVKELQAALAREEELYRQQRLEIPAEKIIEIEDSDYDPAEE